jgi:hypothetical protein
VWLFSSRTKALDLILSLGLKRLESGALVKDYEDAAKEIEQAVQMTLSEIASEDPRFMERDAPPLSEEFPEGSRIFFLGEHAYGVAAQVSATTETSLSVIVAVCLSFSFSLMALTNLLHIVLPQRKRRDREVQDYSGQPFSGNLLPFFQGF